MKPILRTFIEKYVPLSNEDWQLICNSFEIKEFRKNEIILEENKICRYFYLLESGLIRFFFNHDGNDITKTFTLAPYCFTSKISFRKQVPSQEGIQALERCVVWQISFDHFKTLATSNAWNIFIKKILYEIQEFAERFYIEARMMTAEERYYKLLQDYPPELVSKIPLKHLSSFLGIAPQSLSRIRQKIRQ